MADWADTTAWSGTAAWGPDAGPAPSGTPQASTLTWMGHQWSVRTGNGPIGPNNWGRFTENVKINASGYLELAIRNFGGTWYAAELDQADASLGFGTYQVVYDVDLANLAPNVVFAPLWTYDASDTHLDPATGTSGFREFDVEITKWGTPGERSQLWYTKQPDDGTGATEQRRSGHVMSTAGPYTSKITWQPGQVHYLTTDANGVVIGEHFVNDDVEAPANQYVAFQLWLINGAAPSDGKEVVVTVRSFAYTANTVDPTVPAASRADGFDSPYGWRLDGGASIAGSQLSVPAIPAYAAAQSGSIFDLNGSSAAIEVAGVPAVGAGTTESFWFLRYNADNYAMFYVSGGGFAARVRKAGVNTTVNIATFDPVAHRVWRMAHDGTNFVFSAGSSNSTLAVRATIPAAFTTAQLSTMRARFDSGYYGTETVPGSFTVAGINTGAAASASAFTGSAPLAGSGVLSTARTVAVAAAVALAGAGSLTAAGAPAPSAQVALSGTGVVTTSASPRAAQSVALSGSGSVGATGGVAFPSTSQLAGSGSLGAAGVAGVARPVALTGGGSLSSASSPATTGASVLAGAGSLSSTGSPTAAGGSALTGSGLLSASGSATSAATGAAAFAGVGTFTAIGSPTAAPSVNLTGSGALGATGSASSASGASVGLAGAGALTAAGRPASTGAATLAASGQLAATGSASQAGAITVPLTGSGALTVTARASTVGTVTFTGSGNLAGVGAPAARADVTFVGGGNLDAAGIPAAARTAPLAGAGTLTATGFAPGAGRDIIITVGAPVGHPLTVGAPVGYLLTVGHPAGHPLVVRGPVGHPLRVKSPSGHALTIRPPEAT